MAKEPNEIYNPEDVELKMPEDNFIASESEVKHFSLMPLILLVIILILVAILGGLLWWGSELLKTQAPEIPTATRPTAEENNEPESNNAEAEVQILNTLSTSDELSAIEADLFGTDIENLDKEILIIDNELKQ